MAETLTEFITRRRAEIELEEAPLQERLALLRAEKAQLVKAAIAAGLEADPNAEQAGPRRGRKPQEGTIKTHVVAILKENGQGMTAGHILEKLNARNGSTLVRSSLSPQLSRLKQEGIINLTGSIWHLPEQSGEIEAVGPYLFAESGTTASNETHAKDREAGSGGGT